MYCTKSCPAWNWWKQFRKTKERDMKKKRCFTFILECDWMFLECVFFFLPLWDCSHWKHHISFLRKGSLVSLNVFPEDGDYLNYENILVNMIRFHIQSSVLEAYSLFITMHNSGPWKQNTGQSFLNLTAPNQQYINSVNSLNILNHVVSETKIYSKGRFFS